MAVSGIAFLIAKRTGYHTYSLGAAFVAAPTFALFQKR
jgi:hypothetical protein